MSNRIKIKETKLLSDNWYTLNKITYDDRFILTQFTEQSRLVIDGCVSTLGANIIP